MEFTNTESMNKYIEGILDKVILEVTDKILKHFIEEVINKAYVNYSQTGYLQDLMNRDYVSYYNGTGTPTFEFINTFKMIKNEVEKHAVNLMYDGAELKTKSHGAHVIDGEELLDVLNQGVNGNIGGFIEEMESWVIANYPTLIKESLMLHGIKIV